MKTSKRANSVGRPRIRTLYAPEASFDCLISFTADEPDFPTPGNIAAACRDAPGFAGSCQ